MAIVFGLVVDFGDNKQHAENFHDWLRVRASGVMIDGYQITIHAPIFAGYPYGQPTQFQVSVIPANVGFRVAIDENHERIPLNDAQLSQLGSYLYDLLRGAPHFELAMVGWDVDFLLDLEDLNHDWAEEIRDGAMQGLVVHEALLNRLAQSDYFLPFDEHHQWIPYAGSKAFGT